MNSAFWWSDWAYRDGIVSIKSTGHQLPLRRKFLAVCMNWLVFYICMEVWRLAALRLRGPRIAFTPQRPRPWYFIWSCTHAVGGRIVRDQTKADLTIYFEDTTASPPPPLPQSRAHMNFGCCDVSKSHVARVFEQTFGYGIAVDPSIHAGPVVEKSEINGAHDGRVLQAPFTPKPDCAYQRLVDNRCGDNEVMDYRCVIVGRDMPLLFIKRRQIGKRFTNINSDVRLVEPEEAFTETETASLIEFAARMGLEWGAMDVLRDQMDGRLYVVDVNKTNIDPPIAMPLKDKLKATSRVGKALKAFVASRAQG
ncbi:hypothetical protein [Hyphobacterium indicum]|uniref:hypothetical protein n=1 Tax=Hyphobacterium indicum TaxID=2162714 RepID=UPI000D64373F|nr:hypothetical protein [Hyphobacterium indicum]